MLTQQEFTSLNNISKETGASLEQCIKEYQEYHAHLDNLQEQINQPITKSIHDLNNLQQQINQQRKLFTSLLLQK
tara:strand:+ start:157 stop:381 length:225 start_codon:yes stop_codon:yes gene_type:complete